MPFDLANMKRVQSKGEKLNMPQIEDAVEFEIMDDDMNIYLLDELSSNHGVGGHKEEIQEFDNSFEKPTKKAFSKSPEQKLKKFKYTIQGLDKFTPEKSEHLLNRSNEDE